MESGRSHRTPTGPRRANQERVPPRPTQDLDELEAVERLVDVRPHRDRAMPLEQDGAGQRLGWFDRAPAATRAASSCAARARPG